jgi:hypothetical protein
VARAGFLAPSSCAAEVGRSGSLSCGLAPGLAYREFMRCTFEVDGEPGETWTEERNDLPLHQGTTIPHLGRFYEIAEAPRYVADWEASSVSALVRRRRRKDS